MATKYGTRSVPVSVQTPSTAPSRVRTSRKVKADDSTSAGQGGEEEVSPSDAVLKMHQAAVDRHLQRSGQHDTTVQEQLASEVYEDTHLPSRHVVYHTAIDREVHQPHYHTSVQPIEVEETRPEEYEHDVHEVDAKEFQHGDDKALKAFLAKQTAQFKSTQTTADVEHSEEDGDTATGEHVHHHVYKTIQPIIHRKIIRPTIIHTTVPVSEVHYQEAKHYAHAALPTISVAEFEQLRSKLTSRAGRPYNFVGEPKLPETSTRAATDNGSALNPSSLLDDSAGDEGQTDSTLPKSSQASGVVQKLRSDIEANSLSGQASTRTGSTRTAEGKQRSLSLEAQGNAKAESTYE